MLPKDTHGPISAELTEPFTVAPAALGLTRRCTPWGGDLESSARGRSARQAPGLQPFSCPASKV